MDINTLANQIRDALFKAASRTYAEQYIEPIIREHLGLEEPEDSDHDAVNDKGGRIEIKAAKVQSKSSIKNLTLLEKILAENNGSATPVSFKDCKTADYDANIQNVKRDHFEDLVYVLLFSDCIKIFQARSDLIGTGQWPNWSDKHGRYDQVGKSGQFPITVRNIDFHLTRHLKSTLTWVEVAEIVRKLSGVN